MRSVGDFLQRQRCFLFAKSEERIAVGSEEQPRFIRLFAYVDGELDEEQRCLVEALLERDPEACQRVEQIRELNALLKAAYDENGEEKT
jgi:anti-sigma factor RsiW